MSDLPFSGLQVFLAVAEHGSLRKAADVLGVQPPAVSYRLKSLEERIGTSLFVRTTRSVTLTDAGRALLARARPAITELGDAIEDARASGVVRKGAVRITLPYVAYELAIADKLRAFQDLYPDIELEMSFDEAFVDVVAEGFHAGVRLGHLVREDMIAVRLSPPIREVVFGAPSYFDRCGRPQRPEDLPGAQLHPLPLHRLETVCGVAVLRTRRRDDDRCQGYPDRRQHQRARERSASRHRDRLAVPAGPRGGLPVGQGWRACWTGTRSNGPATSCTTPGPMRGSRRSGCSSSS